MNTGKVLLGLITGFAAGASLGIILAPAKDSETWKIFKRKPVESDDPLIEKFIEFLESVSSNDENADKVADDLIKKIKLTSLNIAKERRVKVAVSETH